MKENFPAAGVFQDEAEMARVGTQVRELLRRVPLGVFGTIDSEGKPQMRWMATTTFEDFPCLYTLTAAQSRKANDLESNPQVTWMFTSEDLKFVVNFSGQARMVQKDTAATKKIWHQVVDKSRAYFLGHCVNGPGFAILETVVERIECTFPETERTLFLENKWVQFVGTGSVASSA